MSCNLGEMVFAEGVKLESLSDTSLDSSHRFCFGGAGGLNQAGINDHFFYPSLFLVSWCGF